MLPKLIAISNSTKTLPIIHTFLILLLVFSTLLILKPLTYDSYPDFGSYYYGSQTLINGGNPYVDKGVAIGTFNYPPPAFLLFLPLTLVSFTVAGKIFTVISAISFVLSIYFLLKLFKVKPFSKLGMLFFILSFNFFPAKFTLGMGQINIVVLLAMVMFLYFYLKKGQVLSGIFLAIAVLIKVSPIILFPFLIIEKKWKTLLSVTSAMLIIFLFTYLFIDYALFIHFFTKTIPGLMNAWPADYYNQSLSGLLIRSVNSESLRSLLRFGLTLILTATTLFFVWKGKRTTKLNLLKISLLLSLSLIVSGISWQHHFVWMVIPLVVVFFHIKNNRLDSRYYFVLGISYVLMAFNLKNPRLVPTILQSHVLYGTFLLYLLNIQMFVKENNLKKLFRISKNSQL